MEKKLKQEPIMVDLVRDLEETKLLIRTFKGQWYDKAISQTIREKIKRETTKSN